MPEIPPPPDLPASRRAERGERRLRVLTYNVHGLYLASSHRARRMRAIGALLGELAPDLVALQEAFVERDRRTLLAALAGTPLAHSAYFPSGLVGSGLMVLGTAAIRATRFRAYAQNGAWWKPWQGDWYAGKGVALARFELGCGAVDLFQTHAVASYGRGAAANHGDRCAQMAELADFVRRHARPGVPALVAGDLNATAGEVPFRIATRLGELERVVEGDSGLDHVLAARCERVAVEHVETRIFRESVRIGARRVPLSDHPAVLATLRVAPGPAAVPALAAAG